MHQIKYTFHDIEKCNMCASDSSKHRILGKRMNQSQGLNPRKKKGITVTIIECNSCGLIYSNPQPVPFNIQDHYDIPPENYWNKEKLTISENYFDGGIMRLKGLMQIEKGMKFLDIGTGLGHGMIALSKAGFDSYGFEPSEQFYNRAIAYFNINPEKIKLGKIEDIDYPSNYFDFISFDAVLEHIYDPSAAVEKAIKWLKPNGIIYIEVPSKSWLIGKIINFYYKIIGTDYVSNLSPMHKPYHLYEFDINSFKMNSSKMNYTVVFYEYYVCETFLPKFLNFIAIPIMRWTNTGMQLAIWLKKNN